MKSNACAVPFCCPTMRAMKCLFCRTALRQPLRLSDHRVIAQLRGPFRLGREVVAEAVAIDDGVVEVGDDWPGRRGGSEARRAPRGDGSRASGGSVGVGGFDVRHDYRRLAKGTRRCPEKGRLGDAMVRPRGRYRFADDYAVDRVLSAGTSQKGTFGQRMIWSDSPCRPKISSILGSVAVRTLIELGI